MRLTTRRLATLAVLAGAALGVASACRDATGVGVALPAPASVRAVVVGPSAIRLEWTAVAGATSYRVERRANLTGAFTRLADVVNEASGTISYFDGDVQPETFYGYRVVAYSALGGRSPLSTVAGDRTPPAPGVVVSVATRSALASAIDPDGYVVILRRPGDSTSALLGPNASRRFSPLAPGEVTVALRGIAANCDADATTRTVVVPEGGLRTLATASFDVTCTDPTRGRIVAIVTKDGTASDANGFQLSLTGIASDGTLPDSMRVVSRRSPVSGVGGTVPFGDLRPGQYDVKLEDVQAPCVVVGPAVRQVATGALTVDTVRFAVTCETGGGETSNRPLALRNAWSPRQGATGTRVALTVSMDLSAQQGRTLGSAAGRVQFPQGVLRYDSVQALTFSGQQVNAAIPGELNWISFSTTLSNPPTGVVPLLRFHFTVLGSSGAKAATRSRVVELLEGDAATPIDTALVRAVEDTFTVGSGSGGGTGNQAPTARANGPYTGTVGQPIAFSSSGSSDADGTIASYAWTFGDGTTSTQANPSKTYQSAGTYTATLTVTDDKGATGTGSATVTVSAGGAVNQPPSASANGPYSGVAGQAIAFSSSGSADPDGSIASYAWAFGDGATSTQANPSHAYATAGTYTATLTVTDDKGATASAQAQVAVTAGGGGGGGGGSQQPFTWGNSFGTFNAADSTVRLTISLDLSADIADTPGAEELESFVLDSLKWDPQVLRFFALNWGPGGGGSFQTYGNGVGKLTLRSSTMPPQNRSGVITAATVTFKVVAGSGGRSTTTSSALGPLLGTAATGGFNYKAKTRVQEATFTAP